MDNKEKVQDFLNNRIPFYIDENVRIKIIKGDKSNRPLIEILQDQGYSWISTIRGYIMDDHAMLYVNDFQTPNCNTILIQALFAYFLYVFLNSQDLFLMFLNSHLLEFYLHHDVLMLSLLQQ